MKNIFLACVVSLVCMACERISFIDPDPDLKPDEKTFVIMSGNSVKTSVFESEFSVSIKNNTDYDIIIDCDWIHPVDTRSLNTENLNFKVDFNKTKKERKGEISFVSKEDNIKKTIEIKQRGGLWITCSIGTNADKKSWEATDTIGVYGHNLLNIPFVYCEEQQFVADWDGNIDDVSAAYYPYNSIHDAEITDNDIFDYLVADASLQFDPIAYPITLAVSDNSEEAKCRLVSDTEIFGPWKFTDGKICATSSETEKKIDSGSCVFAALTKAKGNIGVIVKNSNGIVTAEDCYIEMNGAKNITHEYEKGYKALDTDDNANCYIIDEEGSYCFALRDAAGGQRWIGSGCYAEVIWSDFAKDFIINPKIMGDMVFFDAQMSGDKQGNAGLALKDSEGKILWSWHLWLTDQTDFRTVEKGKLLNIPLGSITNSRDFQYGDHYHALIYQYGRKDPFPNQSPQSEFLAITDEGLKAYDNSGGFGTFFRRDWRQGTFDESCPMIAAESNDGEFGYFGDQPENVKWNVDDWDEVNNPCPPGFSVPKSDIMWKYLTGNEGGYACWPGLKVEDLTAVEPYNNGLLNTIEDYWFPAIKGRTPLYGIENQYHPYCGIPAAGFILWIRRISLNLNSGGHYANIVRWGADNTGGVEIYGWDWGDYHPLICVKD